MLDNIRFNAKIVATPSGNSSVGRARPCQGRGREFESRFPLQILKNSLEGPTRGVWAFSFFKMKNAKFNVFLKAVGFRIISAIN